MNFRANLILALLVCIVLCVYSDENKSIVSLAPSLTKMIYLLEAQENLIGCTEFCDNAKDDGKSVVASQMSVNIEKILSVKPDFVITTTLTPVRDIEALKNTGVQIKIFSLPKSFDELCNQLVMVGKLIGKEERALSIVDRERSRLNNFQKLIPSAEKPAMFIQLGVKPLFAVIPDTFMDDYITFAGGENIASDLKHGSITRESVLIRNPDVIIIVLMGIVGKEERNNWKSYSGLKAAKNNKIFLIDADKACSPTPVTFVDTVEEIIKLVYRE